MKVRLGEGDIREGYTVTQGAVGTAGAVGAVALGDEVCLQPLCAARAWLLLCRASRAKVANLAVEALARVRQPLLAAPLAGRARRRCAHPLLTIEEILNRFRYTLLLTMEVAHNRFQHLNMIKCALSL